MIYEHQAASDGTKQIGGSKHRCDELWKPALVARLYVPSVRLPRRFKAHAEEKPAAMLSRARAPALVLACRLYDADGLGQAGRGRFGRGVKADRDPTSPRRS